jgi:hypothetical protein
MAIELYKVRDIQTLALGFNYAAKIDLSTLGSTAGSATAVDIQVNEAAMAGSLQDAAIIVDQLVVGTSISDATIAFGDDGDPDGFVDEVDVFSDSGNLGKIFRSNGALLNEDSAHVVSAVDLTYNFTGEGPDVATEGVIRLLVKYFPTAGELYGA